MRLDLILHPCVHFAETVRQIVTELEQRLAVLLGVPVPAPGDRLIESTRLRQIGQIGKISPYDANVATQLQRWVSECLNCFVWHFRVFAHRTNQ